MFKADLAKVNKLKCLVVPCPAAGADKVGDWRRVRQETAPLTAYYTP